MTRTETFQASEPILARVRSGPGDVTVSESADASVTVTLHGQGEALERATIRYEGGTLDIDTTHSSPAGSGLSGFFTHLFEQFQGTDIDVEIPRGSRLVLEGTSGDITIEVDLDEAQISVGSGSVDAASVNVGDLMVRAGSGDVEIGSATSAQVRTASGDAEIGDVAGAVTLTTGSGDLSLVSAGGPTEVRSGSGDLVIGDVGGSVQLVTGAGDVSVRRMRAGTLELKTSAGDIEIGVRSGLPVWTDVSTMTGDVHASLVSRGQPSGDEPYVEIHATTVTGDIVLRETNAPEPIGC